jgi:hypothetical protein
MDDRDAVLLRDLDRSCRIIEIGPSFAPIAAKADGWATTVVDHAPRRKLIAKYKVHPNVDTSRIEEVDVVWDGGALHEAFPQAARGGYRALIASHVMEHLPDPVGFLSSAALLLDDEGAVLLALPDKRLCFDCLRPTTTTGQVLSAYRARRSRHTDAALFDGMAYDARSPDGAPGWRRMAGGDLHLSNSLDGVATMIADYAGTPDSPYADAHAWVFTPASFELMMLELCVIEAIDLRTDWIAEREGVEFLARLVRGRARFATGATREAKRVQLLRRMLFEIREQTDWLLNAESRLPMPSPYEAVLETRLKDLETVLREVAETAAMQRAALRPVRALWRRLLPLRRVVARMRGRVSG